MKEFLKSLYQNKKRLAGLVVIVLIVSYFGYKHFHTASASVSYMLGQAQKQTIITSVSGTGQVSQDRSVNITPSSSGKITSVYVKQGQAVKAGQVIAVIDETNNVLSLNQAKASLAGAQASYDAVIAGSTSQDLQLTQLSVDSAQQALDQAKTNLDTVTKQQAQALANAQTNLLNSGLAAVQVVNANIGGGAITISGTYSGTESGTYTLQAYDTGSSQQFSFSGLENGTGLISKTTPQALGTKGLYILFSGTIYSYDSWTISIPNTLSSSYSSNNNSYQSALTSQTTAIASAKNQIISAENNLKQAQINQQVKQQPPTNQALASANSQLLSAKAQLLNAQVAYDNNILKSPFDGKVAQLNNQVGDQATASTNIATVVTNQSIAVISLNEVDVAKIKEGDKASMTFDAIEGLTISGKVAQIDQIGTVSQGVVNYSVKIAFDTEDSRVKAGMSVSVSIITNVAADVLSVPNSAVQTQGGNSYVLILEPSQTTQASSGQAVEAKSAPTRVPVQIGLADDSNTQITDGLKEGDSIVVQTINPTTAKSAASSATSATNLLRGAGGAGGGNATFFRTAAPGR